MSCVNPNIPEFQELVRKTGNYLLAEIEYTKGSPVIQSNGKMLNLPEEAKQKIYENYVNLMGRKREGKEEGYDSFNRMFDNLQVFKTKDTYIFGQWDAKNNVFQGRLMSSPNIRQLYEALDELVGMVDFMASVPPDMGRMLERKGMYKLNVDKLYDFKGEKMVKNLYFSNKESVKKIFKKEESEITKSDVIKYDKFFNYQEILRKLNDAFKKGNFDNIYPILKELGIYDYNAYKILNKFKQLDKNFSEGELKKFRAMDLYTKMELEETVTGDINYQLTSQEKQRYKIYKEYVSIISDVKDQIIKNSASNFINIDKRDLFNNPKIYNQLDNELNKTLATYLSKFGIKTEVLKDIQDRFGIDSYAHLDILNKIIYTSETNQGEYPQQAGKIIAYMMQHNPLITEIMANMKRSSMFGSRLSKEDMFDAIGDMISEQLYKKTNTEVPTSILEKINMLIRQFFSFLTDVRMNRINRNVGIIADNILLQNQSLITFSPFKPGAANKPVVRVSFQEALDGDAFATTIVDRMADRFILGGSISFSEQGPVWRPDENQVHDLDWASSYPRQDTKNIFESIYPDGQRVYIREIYDKDSKEWTDTWLLAEDGHSIKNLVLSEDGKNKILAYDIVDNETGEVVSQYIPYPEGHTGEVVAKPIDIFSSDNINKEQFPTQDFTTSSGTTVKLGNWRSSFEAKLRYGRLKDIWDYNRFIPSENIYQGEPSEGNFQLEGMPMSAASEETLTKVRALIEKMGVSMKSLVEYAKTSKLNLDGVNAVADMIHGIIAVAEGKEAVSLTEEMVHIATAILELKNPKMITEMIAKIDRFKIYNITLNAYKTNRDYQLPNGKPDIRKIKKEAVDKLIAELIVNQGRDVAQYPELLEQENINFVQRMWNKVLDWFRGMYKANNVDIFKQTSDIIINDGFEGDYRDIQNKQIYFQYSDAQKNAQALLLKTQNDLKKVEVKEKVDPLFMDTEEASNFYEIQNDQGVWERVEERVTNRVKAWYRQRFGNKTFSKEEQAFNEFKRKFGVKAHGWFEDIHQRYFEPDGTRKISIGQRNVALEKTEEDMYVQLEEYFTDLVKKFSENGKNPLVFSEVKVYDPKEKEAGTLDLVIIDETGKANIFDWKFMSVSQNSDDVAWYKQGAYNIQLGRYKEILRNNYGIKEFGMNRAIPIIMEIKSPMTKSATAEPYVAGIAIGSVDTSKIKELKLIPISEETESTGFDTLDKLIKDLNAVYRQIGKQDVNNEEEKEFKSKRLNTIKAAIRAAQGSLNISPLIEVIREMKLSGQMIIDDYNTTYLNRPATENDITNKELSKFSDEMREYLAMAEIFGRVDDRIRDLIYNSEMEAAATTSEQKAAVKIRKELLDSIVEEASEIRDSRETIKEISDKFADKFIGQRNLVAGLLNPEAVLKGLGSFFNGISDLPLASLKILYKLVNNSKANASRIAKEEVDELMEIRKRLVDRGGDVRSLIKQIYQKDDNNKWVNKLIYKYSKEFYDAVDQNAQSEFRSKSWLENNIDVDAYMEEAIQKMNENISYYERRYSEHPDVLEQIVYEEKLKWDLTDENFNGWNNYIIKRHPLQKWTSEEYIELSKDKDLLELYEFISRINDKAKGVGYIENKLASTFLPFVRKSMAESLAWDASLSVLTSLGDGLTVRAEDVGLGSINELTKELEHSIPKYYTHDFSRAEDGTNDYSDVSEDLFKNMIMYINHMEKYSMLSEIEGQLQLVKTIEAGKDHLKTSLFGDIIIKDGKPDEVAGNKENTQMFEDFMRGVFYEQKYPLSDSDTPLNINLKNFIKKGINRVAGREVYTVEENPSAISLVKSIDALNRGFQLKTLGFEVLSGAVNAFGANIQIATQAGNYFKAREVLVNEGKLIGNKFKNDDERNMFIQLVDAFMPLKDDPSYEKLKKAGLTKLTQGSFSDFLMMFMRNPEQHIEKSVFLTLLQNTMVIDGKLVNIREYVKNKYKDRYTSAEVYKSTSDIMDKEIEELKKTKSIDVIKKLEDGKLVIPGFDLNDFNELQRLTNLTRTISRNATGGMADSDMNRASMNIWLKSMLVFKGWIPKLLKTRFAQFAETSDDFSTSINEDGLTLGQKYDIGRIRLFGHVLGDGIIAGVRNINNIIALNDAGLERLDKMYEDFSKSYEKRTGKVLQMDKADFIDLMRNNLRNQIKELAILMSLFGAYLALGLMAPDDDDDKAAKNFYRFSQRTIDKFVGELSFFYNPVEFQKLLSGSAFPALGLFSDIERFTSHFFMETTGLDLSDTDLTVEEVEKKAQPVKYLSKMFPITKSMITYMALFDADFAKEYDVTIQRSNNR
jgi:hypothetical protein